MSMRSARQAPASISALHVYPLKSAQGLARDTLRLTPTGFEWDRQWMAVAPGGRFLSQRTHPLLARIGTVLDRGALRLRAPGLQPLALPLDQDGPALEVQVWDDHCSGIDQGPAAADWITSLLGTAARLVRAPAISRRLANPAYAGPAPPPLSFADGFQVLVCNSASLEDLNARMD